MIVSNRRKYVFVSTPKTGTHSMYELLNAFEGSRYGNYHEKVMPSYAKNYFKFTTIRNPYDRLVSAWNSLLFTTDEYRDLYIPLIGDDRFESFVEWACENKRKIPHMDVRGMIVLCTQTDYLKGIEIHKHLKIENINEEFNKLHFVDKKVEVPRLLHRKYKSWDELKNKNIIEKANEYLKDDFENFDYEKE